MTRLAAFIAAAENVTIRIGRERTGWRASVTTGARE